MSKRPEPFAWNPNIGAVNGFGIRLPGVHLAATLTAATNTVTTVPALPTSGRTQSSDYNGKNVGYAILKYETGVDFWVAVGVAATPVVGGTFAANPSMLNPECILVYEGDELNFYSTAGGIVSVNIFPWA